MRTSCQQPVSIQVFFWIAWTLGNPMPFPVPFNTTYIGPDGPWQVVNVGIGGEMPEADLSSEQGFVNLMPGGQGVSYVLTTNACQQFPNSTCGQGGLLNARDAEGVSWGQPAAAEVVGVPGLNVSNSTQCWPAVSINSQPVYNVSIGAVDEAVNILANGATLPPQIGWLTLGSESPLAIGPMQSDSYGFTVFTVVGGLYNQSVTPSNSFGFHAGSAPLNYPASLLLGGYDAGRVIGPYTTFAQQQPKLLDIGIGVETGASPFNFTSRSQLLRGDATGHSTSVTVSPDPQFPYLHLPGNTCQAIANLLPVIYNSTGKFYLWNTNDPNYAKIVTSAAYLSFTFPPGPYQTSNVTIKVPFMLLNLTLEPPLAASPTPYFPLRTLYILGRSFLQAAFLGRNWDTHTSWLAQAPGPGLGNAGLGQSFTSIQPEDTTINVVDNASLFAETWSGHWTPLPEPGTSNPASTTATEPKAGLTGGAKAGIGVGVTIASISLLSAIAFLTICYRKKAPATTATSPTARPSTLSAPPPYEKQGGPAEVEGGNTGVRPMPVEAPAESKSRDEQPQEVDAKLSPISELPSPGRTTFVHELQGSGRTKPS
ncbi:MAG: hypothetical protein M1820_005801 [Bogoriella megaspora]|nr:MAG: hypothetical protein M1820_005801 [Bogoriella megaspora]